MPLVTLRAALDAAARGGYAVGAFNVSDLTQAEAVLDAAAAAAAPVVVQTVAGSSAHADEGRWWAALRQLTASYDEVPAVLHLDHGATAADCRRAMDAGFTSVMIDGSLRPDGTPAAYAENAGLTAQVAQVARTCGVSVEGELGTIGGAGGGDGEPGGEIVLADPEEAARFADATGVDALAVAIGTSHGTHKFTAEPDGNVLRTDLIEVIAARVPGVHLVMHGSSTVPHDLVAEINEAGGDLPRSWGVPMAEKVRSIDLGVRKINQGVDSQLAFTAAVRSVLVHDGRGVDPAGYLAAGRARMQALLESRMRAFRSAGRAHDLLGAAA